MHFDFSTVLVVAMVVIAPALFAVMTVKRHVSKFIRDVELEEQENRDAGRIK